MFTELLSVVGVVVFGNFIASIFYIRSFLSGVNKKALFSYDSSWRSLISWFLVNTGFGIFLSLLIILFVPRYHLVICLVCSLIFPLLSYIGNDLRQIVGTYKKDDWRRKIFRIFIDYALIAQKKVLQDLYNAKLRVLEQKNREVMNTANDLRFLFGDKILGQLIEGLLAGKYKLPQYLRKNIQESNNLSGALQAIIKYANIDILRMLLHVRPDLTNYILARSKTRRMLDSVPREIVHLNNNFEIRHLNKFAKKVFDKKKITEKDEWEIIGKNCEKALSMKSCSSECPMIIREGNGHIRSIPCLDGKYLILELENEYGKLLIRAD